MRSPGSPAMRIVTAIVEGERDPAQLAALRDERCKNDEAKIARALEGTWREEHLFELRQAYELYRTCQMKVTECDKQIEQTLAKLPDPSAGTKPQRKVRKSSRKPNNLRFDGTCELAELVPQPSREQPQAEIAAGAEGEKPGGDRVAAGGAVAAALALGAGCLFSAYEQPTGVQRGDHGDGAQAGAIRLCHAQVWRSLRQPEFGRIRGGHAAVDRTYAPKEGPCSGLRSGSQAAVEPSRTVNSL